jgi:hypothetical protein
MRLAVVLRCGGVAEPDRPDQLSPDPEHPEVTVEGDLLASVGRQVALVGDPVTSIRVAVAFVCQPVAFVGEVLAFVGPTLAEFGPAVARVRLLVAQVGQPFALVRIQPAHRPSDLDGPGQAVAPVAGSSALCCLGPSDGPSGPLVQFGLTLLYGGDGPKRRRLTS